MPQGVEEATGKIIERKPNDMYRVELANGSTILCHISSEARMQMTRVLPGDRVAVQLSSFDSTRGRITKFLCE